MNFPFNNFKPVLFMDYRAYKPGESGITSYDIVIEDEFSSEAYCRQLFSRILSIDLSKTEEFLEYQCQINKNPIEWLNTFEKLMKNNCIVAVKEDLKYRYLKYMMEIILIRKEFPHIKNKMLNMTKQEDLNGFTGNKIYSFCSVLEHTKYIHFTEEKILYLQRHIKDYKQNPPEFESNRKPKFDQQCELEITNLISTDELLQKVQMKKDRKNGISSKLPINVELKTLCDIFYKLMKKKGNNKQAIFPWTIKETTDLICNSFVDMNGNSLNPSSVRTYLSPSKYESRPKGYKEIDFDK